jgi:tetratricopeptide (TPR) repeat protein
MLELLVVVTFFGYIFYLRNYADLRSKSEKEEAAYSKGVELYKNGQFDESHAFFDSKIRENPKSGIAYLYRGLSRKGRNKRAEAFQDLQTSASIDDDIFRTHMELGRFFLEDQDYLEALPLLNKAVVKAQETSSEPYYWRAQVYLQLGQRAEAEADLASEKRINEQIRSKKSTSVAKDPFFNKKLMVSMVMAVFTSTIVVMSIKSAGSVHFPYLITVLAAIAIGFVEPNKGWVIALLQCVLVFGGYFLFSTQPETTGARELENFSLYGSLILTMAASFLGGFMKRALSMK